MATAFMPRSSSTGSRSRSRSRSRDRAPPREAASPPASPEVAALHALGSAWEEEEPRVAGLDDDGEAILVEEDPRPHEIAEDPAMRCRYPSKHCQRRRTLKKTGALHSMCAFHRAKANRNQRRLEKRKRLQKHRARAAAVLPPPKTPVAARARARGAPPAAATAEVAREHAAVAAAAAAASTAASPSPRGVSFDLGDLEPFRAPVPLFKEDLDELRALVDAAALGFCVV